MVSNHGGAITQSLVDTMLAKYRRHLGLNIFFYHLIQEQNPCHPHQDPIL